MSLKLRRMKVAWQNYRICLGRLYSFVLRHHQTSVKYESELIDERVVYVPMLWRFPERGSTPRLLRTSEVGNPETKRQ